MNRNRGGIWILVSQASLIETVGTLGKDRTDDHGSTGPGSFEAGRQMAAVPELTFWSFGGRVERVVSQPPGFPYGKVESHPLVSPVSKPSAKNA